MSERMTDEWWALFARYRGSATEDVRTLYAEAERARRVEQEQADELKRKDEAIKELAEALARVKVYVPMFMRKMVNEALDAEAKLR